MGVKNTDILIDMRVKNIDSLIEFHWSHVPYRNANAAKNNASTRLRSAIME